MFFSGVFFSGPAMSSSVDWSLLLPEMPPSATFQSICTSLGCPRTVLEERVTPSHPPKSNERLLTLEPTREQEGCNGDARIEVNHFKDGK